jgi:hypothetical protein
MSGVLIPFHKKAQKVEKEDYNARIEKIKTSLEKINSIFDELRTLSDKQTTKKNGDKP